MTGLLSKFTHDQSGASAAEYGLIAGLVSVIIIAALSSTEARPNTKFTTIGNGLRESTMRLG